MPGGPISISAACLLNFRNLQLPAAAESCTTTGSKKASLVMEYVLALIQFPVCMMRFTLAWATKQGSACPNLGAGAKQHIGRTCLQIELKPESIRKFDYSRLQLYVLSGPLHQKHTLCSSQPVYRLSTFLDHAAPTLSIMSGKGKTGFRKGASADNPDRVKGKGDNSKRDRSTIKR